VSADGRETVAASQLPAATAWLFLEYDFASMDLEDYRGMIIERLLERGTWEQLRWLCSAHGEGHMAEWVRRHGLRLLSKRSFALWRLALGIRQSEAPAWAVEGRSTEGWCAYATACV